MAKSELKAKAIELRRQGWSYKEILSVLPVAKSTLSLWLRDIELTDEQKERLKEKERENRRLFTERYTKGNVNIEACRRGGLRVQEKYGDKVRANLTMDGRTASRYYRKDEIPIKEKLEKITQMKFTKEQIGNKFYDFTNDTYIIEYTIDGTKGLSEAIDRELGPQAPEFIPGLGPGQTRCLRLLQTTPNTCAIMQLEQF